MNVLISLFLISLSLSLGARECPGVSRVPALEAASYSEVQSLVSSMLPEKVVNVPFSSEITNSSINRLLRTIQKKVDKFPENHVVINLNLSSNGGNINEAMRAVREIHALNQDSRITIHTRVTGANTCESACTIMFTAGEKRFASSRARFGFHSPNYVRGPRGSQTPQTIEARFRARWVSQIRAVDQNLAERLISDNLLIGDDMKYVDADELLHGYVTELI